MSLLTNETCRSIFDPEVMKRLFPLERSDQFFEALLGDAEEGAYDIHLIYRALENNELQFDLLLKQRPGKCLACNLTYGLPTVFARHPVIDIGDLVEKIGLLVNEYGKCEAWRLGRTRELSKAQHAIPLYVRLVDHK